MIPQKLQVEGIRFVLLEKSGKKPFQKDWQNKNISFDSPELLEHIRLGGNYGVLGGGNLNLIIIDFDNEKVQEEIIKKIPPTLTIKTGSGKLHKYYFSNAKDSFKIFDEQMNTLIDVQGENKQVVGAGSTHPNGNKYELLDDLDIAFVDYAEVKAILTPYDKKPKKEKKEFEKPKVDVQDDFLEELKSTLSMENVLSSFGVNTSKNPTSCPLHDSKGGQCLGFNGEVAHCFHCEGAWNIFSFVKEMKRCDFKEALVYLANLGGLHDKLEISKRKYLDKLNENQLCEKKEIRLKFLELIEDDKIGKATEIIVDYIKDNYHIYTTKDDNKSEMWVYNGGIYVPAGRSEVKIILRDILGSHYNAYYYNQIVNKLEADTFIEADRFFGQLYPEEVIVNNGILNIYTKELKPFTPEKIFFSKFPVEYNPLAVCPQIDKFLTEVLSKNDDKLIFYEMSGFCLLKEYKFEKAFLCLGDGRNGKDKSFELLKRTFGIENVVSIPLTSLIPDSFIISELFGKVANIAGEISNQDLKDTSEFKSLTGRGIKTASRKFLKPITFVNYAKFIFACNNLPMVYDNSKGFWDRWILLLYPYTFVSREELERTTDKTNLKLRDESIIEKITTPEELSGFLNKILEGFDRLTRNRGFSSTTGSEEIKRIWVRRSNSVMAFCMDYVEYDSSCFVPKKDFKKKYSDYCKEHKIPLKSDFVIKRTLEELFGVVDAVKNDIGGYIHMWEGLKWK